MVLAATGSSPRHLHEASGPHRAQDIRPSPQASRSNDYLIATFAFEGWGDSPHDTAS